ncbi:hypothetical protein [Rhodovulum sulfidophilum]|uniref:Uncharacterized protein n=1 Tax=Rhodovulum sulfidophilum TaxID=35806 RepID=A0ABS1RSF2_RHOSU|nr:hypothetical protein [Rhodovulum sulfidophilum]MBL3608987.1 hypothetical protein [Rhodovulum sulfidophilum]MCE8455521.1 hypothetical protein [Rhodovulum sulfidophilum]
MSGRVGDDLAAGDGALRGNGNVAGVAEGRERAVDRIAAIRVAFASEYQAVRRVFMFFRAMFASAIAQISVWSHPP